MIIIAHDQNQLGNRLVLFANVIAFAIDNNQTVSFAVMGDYADLFESTRDDLFCRFPVKKSILRPTARRRKLLRLACKFVTRVLGKLSKHGVNFTAVGLLHLKLRGILVMQLNEPEFINILHSHWHLFIKGYFYRDSSAVKRHTDTIRKMFTPLLEHRENIQRLINNLRGHCDILIGIHIRHGDYKNFNDGKFYYEVETYLDLMEQAQKLFPNKKVTFLVCSNEKQDSRKFSKFSYSFATNQIIEDMYSLAACDYIIAAPSSYSMWAAYYGGVPLYDIHDAALPLTLKEFVIHKYPDK